MRAYCFNNTGICSGFLVCLLTRFTKIYQRTKITPVLVYVYDINPHTRRWPQTISKNTNMLCSALTLGEQTIQISWTNYECSYTNKHNNTPIRTIPTLRIIYNAHISYLHLHYIKCAIITYLPVRWTRDPAIRPTSLKTARISQFLLHKVQWLWYDVIMHGRII